MILILTSLLALLPWPHPWGVIWFPGLEVPSAVRLACPDPWLPHGKPRLIPLALPRGSSWSTLEHNTNAILNTNMLTAYVLTLNLFISLSSCALWHMTDEILPTINKCILFIELSCHMIWHTHIHIYGWRHKIWLDSQIELRAYSSNPCPQNQGTATLISLKDRTLP